MKNIYIVLSQTGTLFSRAIRNYTKDPYNHASISFDSNLEVMYSFGRKHRYNLLNNGFITENFNSGMFLFFPNAQCCILEIPVTDAEYAVMYETVTFFQNHQQNYRYNLIGVLSYAVGVGLTRKDHFFCSQFVSYLLGKTAFWHSVPELTRPMDFYNLPQKRVVFEGCIMDFRGAPIGRQRYSLAR